MHAVLEAGDHIIVHWPCYQSLGEVARSIGCQVTLWEAREKNGWALDLDELRQHLRPSTKAVVINTPHNPTGYLMSKEDFQAVNRIAQDNGLLLFSDEVYRETEYRVEDRLPAACDLGEHAISLGVMSKSYGLAGLRIGWIATHNAQVYAKMAALKDYTTICNSAPSEFLAELALRHRKRLLERNLGLITRNLVVLDEFFERHPDQFVWQRPIAGPIAFPCLIGEDIAPFCDRLVKTAGVLLLPGTMYDAAGNHFRIGFGRKNLPQAITRLEEFLQG
jgi:aspartate/methionine/tyrosine aminotransferase